MLFFKADGIIENKDWNTNFKDDDNTAKRIREIATKTIEHNNNLNTSNYLFVQSIYKDIINVGLFMEEYVDPTESVHELFKSLDLNVTNVKVDEIKMRKCIGMLKTADRADYVEDDFEILERYGLEGYSSRYGGYNVSFDETIINVTNKKNVYEKSKLLFASPEYMNELDRIYSNSTNTKIMAHPVHYIFEMDEKRVSKPLYKLLANALYQNGRVQSKRVCYEEISERKNFREDNLEDLFVSSQGGTVVVDFCCEMEEETDMASQNRNRIEILSGLIKKYRNQVLTILLLPRECSRTKSAFFEYLANMTFVEVKDNLMDDEGAVGFLKEQAKNNHIRCDKKLTDRIESGETYYADELCLMFDEWYSTKLKTTLYPQYKDFDLVDYKSAEKANNGNAYKELNEMIGLDSAKKVINKALDFYKAQKLFADKGMKQDTAAMHMIFTGNPGTAKTSVARLFARILRENHILSSGHLVEVGRSDLVARFVGWTGKTVKSIFKRAEGGVLFIDEAYSLVDDRDGSFGDEAINTIVQEMENMRDRVVVIFAGYPDKMKGFLDKNPGLRSRIAFHVDFEDYNSDELCDIARLMAKKQELTLTDGAVEKLNTIFDQAKENTDFGNGRFVRNVLEDAKMSQASRLVDMEFDEVGKKEIKTIIADDIEMPVMIEEKKEEVSIGFVS